MEIYLIVAKSKNNAIGKDNSMLWHLPNDLRFFKNTTLNHFVIMGRKTYESLGTYAPLPDRINLIITRNKTYVPKNKNENTHVFFSLKDAVLYAETHGCEKLFIAGGGEIYREALEQKDFELSGAFVTEVHADVKGDTLFPNLRDFWNPIKRNVQFSHKSDKKHFADFDVVLCTQLIS